MLKRTLMPYVARMLSSALALQSKRALYELKRRLRDQPHRLDVFISISDPYSYLLIQVLPELMSRFDIAVQLHTVRDKQAEMFPDLQKWQTNSLQDARFLAELYGLNFPAADLSNKFDQKRIDQFTSGLLSMEQDDDAVAKMLRLFDAYWMQNTADNAPPENRPELLLSQLASNQQLLSDQGHYLSAMIQFGGEWYWGLDRLDHLEKRLNDLLPDLSDNQVLYDLQTRNFCALPASPDTARQPLTIYFSARSPYSYLGLQRAVKLCEHYACRLIVKPVLPMMMRGMNVPQTKKMYIFHDTKREATKLGIPYGFVADPLGKAVENCYELFEFAKSKGKEIDYLIEFSRMVNSEGIYADNEAGMRLVLERAGLHWQEAKVHVGNQDWRQWVEHNMQELNSLGLWGVPCFQYGEWVTWGQDRLWLIEKAINNTR